MQQMWFKHQLFVEYLLSGNTLGEIAGEKAGIFKEGVPAFTVPQPEEAMHVLEENASKLNVNLQVVSPLNPNSLRGLQLGLDGKHQFVNAGLAVALCSTWLQRTGLAEIACHINALLPEEFIKGLTMASFQGRAQIVSDECSQGMGDLVFYLDGAHSPESMEVCASWFCHSIKQDKDLRNPSELPFSVKSSVSCGEFAHGFHHSTSGLNSTQILLFNCMSVRDPQLLLPRLVKTCASNGVQFKQALFVPNISLYNKVMTTVAQPDSRVDLSWQLSLQRVWENLSNARRGRHAMDEALCFKPSKEELDKNIISGASSKVFPTLPLAIRWLRDKARENRSASLQVLVTGSLHLVGDVLRLIRK